MSLNHLTDVLEKAWSSPFRTQSDFARSHADYVAMAASEGLITTRGINGSYTKDWRITQKGLAYLETLKG